jgi:3-hydroxy-9,10-secoandrosta-1,3,5(10)-triene-9,17-dione monooxygenase
VDSPTMEQVIGVLPRIREEAARTEAERRVPTEVLAALMDAGVFTLDDAAESGTAQLLEVVHLVAGACGSTGWLTAQVGAVPWVLAQFPDAARQPLGSEPGANPLVAFSPDPAGRLVESDGGLVLEGRWPAVTGAVHASWLVLACREQVGGEPGRVGLVLVRAEDCQLDDPVDTVGLSASGAQDVVASAIRVPPEAWAPASRDGAAALGLVGAAAAMALVGAARGALDVHLEQVRQRVALSHGGEDVSARDLSPAKVGRAASQLDAATLLLREQAGAEADPDAAPRDPFDDQLYAVDRAVEAAGLVFGSVRGHALANDDPVARLWRDVRVGAHHARSLIGMLRALAG